MEVSGAPADVLLQRPWRPVNISGCQLLAKTWFGDSSYHILLTDTVCVWEEWMDPAAIQRRSQELNKRLRAPVKAFFSHLCEVVQPCLSGSSSSSSSSIDDDEAQISLQRHEGGDNAMVLRLKSELAGLPFYWEFHCTPAPVTMACVQLVRPLLTMSRLLQRQVEQLGRLLTRKDAEIQDYRENGATLTRERLQTDVFEEQTYREDFMAKALPVLLSEQKDAPGFDVDLQRLYASVVAAAARGTERAQKRKLSEKEEEPRVGDDGAAAEEPELTPSLAVGGETVVNDQDQRNRNGQAEEAGAKIAERATVQQSRPARSVPAERAASKPKKKKVGLFR